MPDTEDISTSISALAHRINAEFAALLNKADVPSSRLREAMAYSLSTGGKRLRPALALWCCEVCGGGHDSAMPAALAVELVHTFSLIHDDLPALDDDDLRRGRPTCHKQFGEAVAILAGDALLAMAFEVLAAGPSDPATTRDMTRELAEASGWRGMIGGEAADLDGESEPPDAARVASIHAAKTARLMECSCRLGGMAAKASRSELAAVSDYGRALGLAFQAVDDILDYTGRSESLGKRTGKDAVAGKQTYPRAVGMEEARRQAERLAAQAVGSLNCFGGRADRLRALARYVVTRET
jgi:geranylgeranyl diphosphate synthase type II